MPDNQLPTTKWIMYKCTFAFKYSSIIIIVIPYIWWWYGQKSWQKDRSLFYKLCWLMLWSILLKHYWLSSLQILFSCQISNQCLIKRDFTIDGYTSKDHLLTLNFCSAVKVWPFQYYIPHHLENDSNWYISPLKHPNDNCAVFLHTHYQSPPWVA